MIGLVIVLRFLETLVLLETEQGFFSWLIGQMVSPLWFILVALFGVGYLLPRLWIHGERALWKTLLGRGPDTEWVIDYAVKDYQLLIKEIELDREATRMLAILIAVLIRIKELRRLYSELERMRLGKAEEMFTETIEKLNSGWRTGTPAKLLDRYIIIILQLADKEGITEKERLRGLSSVAMVQYALGKLEEGNRLGERSWNDADKLGSEADKSEAKWMASYGYFNSTLFLGHFEKAMGMLTRQWATYSSLKNAADKENLIKTLSGHLTLNPLLTEPRHIILAAAFNDGPVRDPEYDDGLSIMSNHWPSEKVYKELTPEERKCEIKWCESWYQEAEVICDIEERVLRHTKESSLKPVASLSLNFSHAYAGFYFTLLLNDPKVEHDGLPDRINEAFAAIEKSAPIVSLYVKHGFSGVYHLVRDQNEKALESLQLASVYSSISGNRFAECIFMCCHALAAARLKPAVETEINYYLREAERLAYTIRGNFYPALSAAAYAAVARLRGDNNRAARYELRSRQAIKGRRILRIFLPDI